MPEVADVLPRLDALALDCGFRPGGAAGSLAKKVGRELGALGGLAELLAWHDGSDDDFVWNYRLLGADEIGAIVADMRGHLKAGEFDDKIDWWVDGWVPFLDNGGGDTYCVDLVGSFGGMAGQVIEFWHDAPERHIVAPSLASWLGALAGALEAGLEDDAFDAHVKGAIAGYPKEASARKNDVKAKARVSARDAIKNAIDPLAGPREGLAKRIEVDKVVKACKFAVEEATKTLLKRRGTAKAEVFEVFPAPGEKKIAYAVWSTSTVGDDWRDGYVVGIDLKGGPILKEKKVQG